MERHRSKQDIKMARKKRTDEEAAAGAVAPPCTGQQSQGNVSKSGDAAQGSNTKSGLAHGPGRQNKKGGESASRPGSATSSPATLDDDIVNGSASSPNAGSSAPNDIFKEQAAAAVGAIRSAAASEGLGTPERREIDTTGMSASRKKNLKKKLRRQELKQQEAELNNAMQVGAGAASLASRLNQFTLKWSKRVEELEASSKSVASGGSAKHIYEAVAQLQKEIQEVQDEEVDRAKKPINKRASVQQVQDKIREAELTIQKQQKELQKIIVQESKSRPGNDDAKSNQEWAAQSQLEESLRYLAHLKEQLVLTQQQSDLRAFQQQAAEIKASLEQIVKQVQKAGQQASTAADARRVQQKEGMWRKRLQEVGAIPPAGGAVSLITVPVLLPSEAGVILLTPQGQPSLMLRKVERKFNVLVEKKGINDKGITFSIIAYTQDACDNCASFLNETNFPQVPIGFATSPNCISLEGQKVGAFIGSGGANLRKLEAEHDVLLWLEDKWITVLGHEGAVKKAIPQIKEARSPPPSGDSAMPQCRCEFKAEIVRAIAQGSAGTRAKVQEVESSTGVTIMARPPRRGDTSKTATVSVRGSDAEACKKACAELENAFKSFGFKVIDCDRLKAGRLLRGAAVDFSQVQSHELISLLRCDEGVLIVAPAEALGAAVEAVNGAMHRLNRATETLEIKATQLRILDRNRRSEIETLSGATCRAPVHDGEKATLTFTGHPDAVQKALEMAQQILEEQKEEELELSIAAALLFLVDKAHRALEEQQSIRIRVDVPRERLIVRGASGDLDAVTEAIKKVEEEVVSSGRVAVKLDVPREAVPVILGRQGANVRRLQSDCNLDNIVIDGRPQAVYMLGSQAAIDQAMTMVQEIVSNSGGARQQNGDDRRPRLAGARPGGRGGRTEVGGRPGGVPSKGRGGGRVATPAKPYDANVDDENAFPSLGVCMARPGGRWQKKSPALQSASDDVAKASNGEHGDAEYAEAGVDSAN